MTPTPILAKSIMTPMNAVVPEDMKIMHLVTLLREKRISGLPVMQDGKMLGVVSVADVFKALQIAQNMHFGKLLHHTKLFDMGKKIIRVKDIYQRKPVSLPPDSPIEQVLESMVVNDLHALPIIDKNKNVLCGMIGRHDLTWAIFGIQASSTS